MEVRVSVGGRVHFGFLNLSLGRERLYGGIGLAVDRPRTTVVAAPADASDSTDADACAYVESSCELLGVDGASVRIEEAIPRHAGLGSGTQLALAVHAAVARAHDVEPDSRSAAPALDRGGRSGVGVAAFEGGGFVVDAGHPVDRFTTERPPRGGWEVPPVAVHHDVADHWRFVLARPDIEPGRSRDEEDESIRAAVERADPEIADDVSALVVDRLLPAIATGDRLEFGRAVEAIGRLNGVWYAAEQGGVYRPPIGTVVDELSDSPAISGAGQSSWGPTVYGVTDADHVDEARRAATRALAAADVDGTVSVTRARNEGARIEER